LSVAEFAFPGSLRDKLVAAILAGERRNCRIARRVRASPNRCRRSATSRRGRRAAASRRNRDDQVKIIQRPTIFSSRSTRARVLSVADWRAAPRFWPARRCGQCCELEFSVTDETLTVAERF
jgi:hypothetical protein